MAGSLTAYAGIAVGNVIIAAFRQSYSPAGMCGRVTATIRFLIFGTSPLGALLGGCLGTWLGVRPALWVLLGAAALAGSLLASPALTPRRDLPVAPPPRPHRVPAAALPARAGSGGPAWRAHPQFRTCQEALTARPKFVSLAEMPARSPAVTAYNAHTRRNPPPPRGRPMTSESHHRY